MVSIQKAKQGFTLRRNRRNQQLDREKVGLIAAGVCVGFLLIVMWNSMGLSSDSSNGVGFGGSGGYHNSQEKSYATLRAQKDIKPHPHLEMGPMSDNFNAIAQDILDTLGCEKLFKDTLNNINNYDTNNENDYIPSLDSTDGGMANERRRRLDDQHGDDGGFEENQSNEEGGDGDTEDEDDDSARSDASADGGKINNNNGGGGDFGMDDEYTGAGGGDGAWVPVSAKHLFCIAASEQPPNEISSQIRCDAAGTKRRALLDIWTSARAQIPNNDILLKVLELSTEQIEQTILDQVYNLWAPTEDQGFTYMISTLNNENDADHEGLRHLGETLGPHKLFVDVGSGMGLTTLAVSSRYPGTKIVSLEPASPNWLLQEINLRCNLEHDVRKHIHVVLAGVGVNANADEEEETMMAKLMWRPAATTSTRAWTPASEHSENDLELIVRLRRLKSILAEADVYDMSKIDVLNVDCEGCEYNLIPALTHEEFESIPTVMGSVHWGYIPTTKLPSSKRGQTTHERLCQHENIARVAKECCAFPDLEVRSRNPNEVLLQDNEDSNGKKINNFQPKYVTVADVVTGNLCDDFDTWAAEHYLNDVPNDWGWLELTSQA